VPLIPPLADRQHGRDGLLHDHTLAVRTQRCADGGDIAIIGWCLVALDTSHHPRHDRRKFPIPTMEVLLCLAPTSLPLWVKSISTWRVSKGMGRPSRPRFGLLKTVKSCMSTPWRTPGR